LTKVTWKIVFLCYSGWLDVTTQKWHCDSRMKSQLKRFQLIRYSDCFWSNIFRKDCSVMWGQLASRLWPVRDTTKPWWFEMENPLFVINVRDCLKFREKKSHHRLKWTNDITGDVLVFFDGKWSDYFKRIYCPWNGVVDFVVVFIKWDNTTRRIIRLLNWYKLIHLKELVIK